MEKDLEFEIVKSLNGSDKPMILYEGESRSLYDLAKTSKALANDLSPQILIWRWNRGYRKESKLFATKDKRGRNKDRAPAQQGGLFDKCSRELADACLSGSNQELLSANISRAPYVTPGEKRRMANL